MDKQTAFTNVKNSLKFILLFLMSILLLMGEMHESFQICSWNTVQRVCSTDEHA
jgi:hypothetical protein